MLDGDEPGKPEPEPSKDVTPDGESSTLEKKETPRGSYAGHSIRHELYFLVGCIDSVSENTAPISFMSPFKAPIPNGSVSKRKPGNASLNLFFRKVGVFVSSRRLDLDLIIVTLYKTLKNETVILCSTLESTSSSFYGDN